MKCNTSSKLETTILFGCINVCGLKHRLNYPEFDETLTNFDILCVTETKLDHTDVISVPGYNFLSQQRKQKFIRKSGGIGIFYRNRFEGKFKIIDTESDYILWVKFEKTLFGTEEDPVLGVLYIPPAQSRFLNDDEYSNLETEITAMCGQSSYICLTGDMNARTSELCDFITADDTIADLMNFDDDTLRFYNQSEELEHLNVNKRRVSCDKKTNNNGYRLIDICINNNLFILNGRCFKDKSVGKCTFKDQSLIDYTICSVNFIKLLRNFEVIETDSLLSDAHALLSWSFTTSSHLETHVHINSNSTFKKWDQRRVDDFISNIPINALDDLNTSLQPTKFSINKVTNEISSLLADAAKRSFPTHKPRKHSVKDRPWFGTRCREARRHYHYARKTYKRFRNNTNLSKLQQSSKTYKKTMNYYINLQKHKNATKLRQMQSSSPKDYWRFINSLSNKTKLTMPPLEDFYNYFKELNESLVTESFDFEDSVFNIGDPDEILNVAISQTEISSAIRGLKTGKSPGYDEILNEYIKCTEHLLMPVYIKLFNTIFDTGTLPEAWLEGKIRPIYKNKGDKSDPENYRPITILSCLSKLFTAVLNTRLTKFLDTYELLNENQAGFRKGYSTVDHIFALNSLIELFRSTKKKLYCTFIDFSKAFDSVWRIGLWKKMLGSSINGKFLRIVHNMYAGIKSSVSVQGEDSPFFACDCGVRQGENLSPVLFSIYLNDLESYLLHKNLAGVTIDINDNDIMIYMKLFTLLYADDTALMADSAKEMQNCLNAFASYCQEWKLTINTEKTKILIFGARKRSDIQFKLNKDIIEIVNKYKYLGVYFSQSGSFLNARKHIVQQAKKAMSLLFTRINNLDLPLDLQLKLFDHTVLPILTYSSEVWGYENLDLIEKVQNDFLRKITLAKKSTPLYMLYGELGRFPIELTIKSRMIGYWNRLVHSKETKLSFLLYQCLLHSSDTVSKWQNHIKNIFIQIGRPDFWMEQIPPLKSLSHLVKKILTDQYVQNWLARDSQSLKAITYFSFKHDFELEKYFTRIPRKQYLRLFKLRTSNHKFPVETGRWDGTDARERKCQLCTLDDIGDELHYICKCPYFDSERRKYVKPYYFIRPNMFKLGKLLQTNNKSVLNRLCMFVKVIFQAFR